MEAWTRPPLAAAALARLPIGSIRARGWLAEQLRCAADGLTGRMMEIWPDVGAESAWLGGPGERWERGPYYARGLTALAHTLPSARLQALAGRWIEAALASQRADGLFGPADPEDWWPRMPMLDALRLHEDATGDPRVPAFVTRYLRWQLETLPVRPLAGWAKPRGGDNVAAALWLYRRTGDPFLLALADLLCRQTSDWVGELDGDGPPSAAFEFAHGVNRAMGLRFPLVAFQRSGDPRLLAVFARGWERTFAHHGQIQGTFSSDESLHGRGSTQGAELCAIVELLATCAVGLETTGAPWLGDAIERLAFNALPAILSPDLRGHQYYELPNQIACTPGPHRFWVHHGTDLLFGPATGYGCCAANLHGAWPGLVNHLWLATPDDGVAAVVLAPSTVTVRAGGAVVTILEETAYPFAGEVRFTVRTPRPVRFPLHVRVPGWAAAEAVFALDGRDVMLAPDAVAGGRMEAGADAASGVSAAGGTARLVRFSRLWSDGDTLVLRLPMSLRVSRWERGSIGIERGPLVFALAIGEEWRRVGGVEPFADYELHPTTPWNYGLVLDTAAPERTIEVVETAGAAQPWSSAGTPLRLIARGRRIAEWGARDGVSDDVPEPGAAPVTPIEPVTLVPFGCARLRVSIFPIVR